MKQKLVLLLILFGNSLALSAQLKWLTFPEAVEQNEKKPKKVFVDVYTDWCGWCKVMERNTFSDTSVTEILNKYYYSAKLNAESRETYSFAGYTFEPDPKSKVNPLAAALLQGKLSYPSVLFLDEHNKLITVVPGYLKPENLKPILLYLAQDLYKTTSYENFIKTYKNKGKP